MTVSHTWPRNRKTWMKMYLPSKTDAGSTLMIMSGILIYSINTQTNTERGLIMEV